jgi:hypothetical protein
VIVLVELQMYVQACKKFIVRIVNMTIFVSSFNNIELFVVCIYLFVCLMMFVVVFLFLSLFSF